MDKTIAKVSIKPENIDDFIELTKSILEPTRAEDGCIFYEIYQSDTDPSVFYYVEQWESEESFMKHVQSQYVADFGKQASKFEAGPVEPFKWHKIW